MTGMDFLGLILLSTALYGALYLAAFWDPYGRLDHVPAALVMEDRAATATDGSACRSSRSRAPSSTASARGSWS